MVDTVFIIAAISGWFIGMFLISGFIKRNLGSEGAKRDCPPHIWEELETAKDSGLVYLKCKNCNKTLDQVMKS